VISRVGGLEWGTKFPHILPPVRVDHLVTYVLYHSDQVSPDKRDMNGVGDRHEWWSKWFTCLFIVSIIRGSGSKLSTNIPLKWSLK
jgi:hypothetical protein